MESGERVQQATPQQLLNSARHWLSDGVYSLEVRPYAEFQTAKGGADRSKLPEPGAPPDTKFPQLERATLSNVIAYFKAQRSTSAFDRADRALAFEDSTRPPLDARGGWYDATGDYGIHFSRPDHVLPIRKNLERLILVQLADYGVGNGHQLCPVDFAA